MTDLDIAPLKTAPSSATDQVFETLFNAIVATTLSPGTKVSEADIAQQLGVSRQPVRDAFFRLSNLGFLSIRPQRATVITQISLRAIDGAVFTRIALETECLRAGIATQKQALTAALSENLALNRAKLNAPAAEFHMLDERFHEIICSYSGHAHVWTLVKQQKAHLDRIRFLTLSEPRRTLVIEEHERIISAVSVGNTDLAQTELRNHITGVQAVAQSIKNQYPSYFEG